MINDILNKPTELKIEDKIYTLEFDNKAYGLLEQKTGKGIFQIFDSVINSTLGFSDYIEIAVCGLNKHHKKSEINDVKCKLEKSPYLVMQNMPAICTSYIVPLTPPEVMKKAKMNDKKGQKKK